MPSRNLMVPMRAEGPNGEIGDGWVEIGPDHPDYDEWLAEAEDRIEDEP